MMPFDANQEQPAFLSEKARRLLNAHDREVGRNQDEKPLTVEFVQPNRSPYSEVA
jgi:hypothetical protein